MIDLTKVTDVKVEGVDTSDYPKFCDAFVGSAKIDGREATEEECQQIVDEHYDFFYELIMDTVR